jgi:Natural resistance-associated macrophage protein
VRHSLHRKPSQAMGFYGVYFALILMSAVLVLTPGTPLGLLTNAVQSLAGVLLPSATVFLLLLCNDRAVLGPWVNTRRLNLFTGVVIAVLVMLSLILTVSVLFPGITGAQIAVILIGGSVLAVMTAIGVSLVSRVNVPTPITQAGASPSEPRRDRWRMPPLEQLSPARLTMLVRVWLIVLRVYLVVAGGLVLVRIVTLAVGGAD